MEFEVIMKMKKVYKEKNVTLYRKVFSEKSLLENLEFEEGSNQDQEKVLKKVSLWNLSPPSWPGRPKSKLDDRELASLMKEAFRNSNDQAHLVLWMPAKELHRTPYDPLTMAGLWSPIGTILSGSDPVHIGFVYANSQSWIEWTTKLILDGRGHQGVSSTKAMKFMLDELGDLSGPIVDVFAHRSALLPSWARRLGYQYIGYTKSKKTHASIVNALAQVELPGIQLSCLPT